MAISISAGRATPSDARTMWKPSVNAIWLRAASRLDATSIGSRRRYAVHAGSRHPMRMKNVRPPAGPNRPLGVTRTGLSAATIVGVTSVDADSRRPRVLILGGGFAGIGAARALKDADADVVVVD